MKTAPCLAKDKDPENSLVMVIVGDLIKALNYVQVI